METNFGGLGAKSVREEKGFELGAVHKCPLTFTIQIVHLKASWQISTFLKREKNLRVLKSQLEDRGFSNKITPFQTQ